MEANTIIYTGESSYKTWTDNHNNLWVQKTGNVLTNACPKNLNYKIEDFEILATAKAYKQALGTERLKDLDETKQRLSINCCLSPAGKILELEFLTSVNTTLTIKELEDLENALKSSVSFKIVWLDNNEANFVGIGTALPFSTVLFQFQDPGTSVRKIKTTTIKISPRVPPNLE